MQRIYILLLVTLFSCNRQEVLNEKIKIIIEKYVDDYENEALKNKALEEHNIYLIFFTKNEKGKDKEFAIFENIYYLKDKISGHMKYKDNLIVFYGLNENSHDLVNRDLLSTNVIKKFPDDTSDQVNIPYDPLVKKYIVKEGGIIQVIE